MIYYAKVGHEVVPGLVPHFHEKFFNSREAVNSWYRRFSPTASALDMWVDEVGTADFNEAGMLRPVTTEKLDDGWDHPH